MNRIKDVLREKGISQKWLASKINKSYNMTNSYVQNRRQPSIKILFEIAELLNVKASTLISDDSLKLGGYVYHKDIYNGHERMKIVGMRKKTVELEGDYSGGTHNVCQRDWKSIEGVLFQRAVANEV